MVNSESWQDHTAYSPLWRDTALPGWAIYYFYCANRMKPLKIYRIYLSFLLCSIFILLGCSSIPIFDKEELEGIWIADHGKGVDMLFLANDSIMYHYYCIGKPDNRIVDTGQWKLYNRNNFTQRIDLNSLSQPFDVPGGTYPQKTNFSKVITKSIFGELEILFQIDLNDAFIYQGKLDKDPEEIFDSLIVDYFGMQPDKPLQESDSSSQ